MSVSYSHNREKILDIKIDWVTVLVYFMLVLLGWISIYSSTFSGEDAKFYDLDYRYGMQLVWICISIFISFLIMFLDVKYFYTYSYLVYVFMLLLMLLTLMIGKEVNGAKSWLGIGSFGIQSVEFMKIGVALALARFVSSYNFSIKSQKSRLIFSIIIVIPIILSLLQNDTGSALVFLIFALVLYREGMSYEFFLFIFLLIFLFVLSFILERSLLFLLIFLASVVFFAIVNKDLKNSVRYTAIVLLLTIILCCFFNFFNTENVFIKALILSEVSTLPLLVMYKRANFKSSVWSVLALSVSMIFFVLLVDFAFDNILKTHQQVRILNLFGIQNDPRGTSYNVTQSMIAIGSGGISGKGLLKGTQTQYSYVPEQETDFIFCTIGEEKGFLGTSAVVILFSILVWRLLLMGERAEDTYVRAFCYAVASVFLFHFVINISMTIGLFPVIGIPLPFFSYGGSSMLAFSVMLAIAVRLDSTRKLNNF